MKLFTRIKQALCGHVVDPLEIRRVDLSLVEATCWKCGKVKQAEYGLALDARFLQDPARPVNAPIRNDLLDLTRAAAALGKTTGSRK